MYLPKYNFLSWGGVKNICKYLMEGGYSHKMAVPCFNDKQKDVVNEVNEGKVYRVATGINWVRQVLLLSYFTYCIKH